MVFHHAHARARGCDDQRVAFAEGMQEVLGDRACLVFKPIIEERLSAAGLLRRKDHVHAKTLQNVGHVLQRRGIELVAKTGDKKLGFWHLSLKVPTTKGHKGTQRKIYGKAICSSLVEP